MAPSCSKVLEEIQGLAEKEQEKTKMQSSSTSALSKSFLI